MFDTIKSLIHADRGVTHHHTSAEETSRAFSYSRFLGPAIKPLVFVVKKSIHALRPSAYASEVGESTKSVAPRWVYKSLYGISGLYILTDTVIRVDTLSENDGVIEHCGGQHKTDHILVKKFGDTLLWHSMASFIFPGLAVHKTVHLAQKLRPYINPATVSKGFMRAYPPLIGLAIIPFIIHPLDHAADWVMDNTIRRFYSDETNKLLFLGE